MHRAKTQSDNSKALSAERKASKAIYRRFTQMDTERNPFKNITAEAQRAQRINFLFVGRRRQTKTFLKLELEVLPNRRLPIGQKEFPQRTLRLCGEMFESLSAIIGENPRLNSLRAWLSQKAHPPSGGVFAQYTLVKSFCRKKEVFEWTKQ